MKRVNKKRQEKLTLAQVKHIANLAMLELDKNELAKLSSQLSETINYINVLGELDIGNIKPTLQVFNLKNRFKNDEVIPSFTQKEALANAKKTYHGYFVVPYVFI